MWGAGASTCTMVVLLTILLSADEGGGNIKVVGYIIIVKSDKIKNIFFLNETCSFFYQTWCFD